MYEYEKISIFTPEYDKMIEQIEELRLLPEDISASLSDALECAQKDVYHTTSIEGNKLNPDEVIYVLENNVTVRGKSLKDHLQVRNYTAVLALLKEEVALRTFELNADTIQEIHHMVTLGELNEKESGQFRAEPVNIKYTSYIPPEESEIPVLIEELCANYYKPLGTQTQFERICEFKRNYERIHPFIDGNGRSGRLLMNLLLLQNGYGYFSAPAKERDLYFNSLDDNTFHMYAASKVLEQMKVQQKKHQEREDTEYDE